MTLNDDICEECEHSLYNHLDGCIICDCEYGPEANWDEDPYAEYRPERTVE